MTPIDFTAKKQERDEFRAEWDAMYQELCLYTTSEERAEMVFAFYSGDESRKQAIIQRIQDRHRRESGK